MDLRIRHLSTCNVRIGHLKWTQKTPSGNIIVDISIEGPEGVGDHGLEHALRKLAEDLIVEYGGNR